jgi:hypothetical protein
MMRVAVSRVSVPAMSTIGYGYGTDVETGDEVKFAGDHRPMRELGEGIPYSTPDDPIIVEIEGYQILERRPARQVRA